MAPDPRKVVGAIVTCKATLVTNIQECSRRYGSNAKSKILEGVVLEVINERNAYTFRSQTYINGDWNLGNGRTKRASVHIRHVQAKDINTPAPATPTPTAENPVAVNENLPTPEEAIAAPHTTPTEHDTTTNNNNINDNNTNNTNNQEATTIEQPPQPPQTPARQLLLNNFTFSPDTPDTPAEVPITEVIRAHGREWIPYRDVGPSINGPIPYREWGLRIPTGEIWRDGSNRDETISRLDVFLQMFPNRQLHDMYTLTNLQLTKKRLKETTKSELLKFMGILILSTRFEWNNRSDLWAETAPSKYELTPQFGKRTGMKRKRFDELWANIKFSSQPEAVPEGMSLERYRWMLVDGFINNFNNHRSVNFIPTDRICVDESFSRWYGQGGNWINHGLPMFVSMERKPEDGCEIQNSCCGRTGIMIQLKLVKTKLEEESLEEDNNNNNNNNTNNTLNHGTQVLLKLVQPWFHTNRVVCADSYFASVQTAKELLRVNMKFIGVVKTATREYPMPHLTSRELGERGDRYGLLSLTAENVPELLAFTWLDRDRRYFISSCSSLQEGQPLVRERWRQLVTDLTTPPEKVQLTIPQTACSDIYFAACGKIDQHNRDRQSTLCMERKFKTHDWSMRVNMSIVAMCIVDTWRVWALLNKTDENSPIESQKQFYGHLAAELIDNTYDQVGGTSARVRTANVNDDNNLNPDLIDPVTGLARPGDGVYLRRCTRKRKNNNHVHQGRCKVCHQKTSYVCGACADDENDYRQPWICNSETGRMCFATHRAMTHND